MFAYIGDGNGHFSCLHLGHNLLWLPRNEKILPTFTPQLHDGCMVQWIDDLFGIWCCNECKSWQSCHHWREFVNSLSPLKGYSGPPPSYPNPQSFLTSQSASRGKDHHSNLPKNNEPLPLHPPIFQPLSQADQGHHLPINETLQT